MRFFKEMQLNTLVLTTIIFEMITLSHQSNILGIFPYSGYSHFRVFYPIMNGLAELGHNVTVISYYEADKPHPKYRDIVLEGERIWNNIDIELFEPTRSLKVMFTELLILSEEGAHDCDAFYNSKALTEIFQIHKETPFELLIMEMFNTDCILGVAELMSLPVVGLSSCALMPWHYDRVGLPDFPSFIPSEFVEFSQNMNFAERFVNFIITKSTKLLYRFVELHDNRVIKEKLKIDVDVRDIAKKRTSLVLVNQHYSLSGPRVLTNKVIEIGGIHISAKQMTLPKDLEEFINNSKHGVIFINWGSNLRTSSIDKEKVEGIIKAVNKLPQNIVWKWEDNSTAINNNEKFYYSSWYPQKDVLCHENVKAFWSHGGLLGISETCYCGLPALVTPMYGDQFLNAKALKNRGTAKILLYNEINEENVYNSLKEILKKEYMENAKKLSKIYRNRQNTPLETALWWIESILTTKDNNLLHLPSVDMNWFVYYSLDVISILFLVFGIILTAFVFSVKKCFCKLSKTATVVKPKRKSKTS